jgi:hypothetical protein
MASGISHDVDKTKSSLQHMACKALGTFYCSVSDCSGPHMVDCKADMDRRRGRYPNMRDYMSCTVYCIAPYKYRGLSGRSDHRPLDYRLCKRACSHVHRRGRLHMWQDMGNHPEAEGHSNEPLLCACNLA